MILNTKEKNKLKKYIVNKYDKTDDIDNKLYDDIYYIHIDNCFYNRYYDNYSIICTIQSKDTDHENMQELIRISKTDMLNLDRCNVFWSFKLFLMENNAYYVDRLLSNNEHAKYDDIILENIEFNIFDDKKTSLTFTFNKIIDGSIIKHKQDVKIDIDHLIYLTDTTKTIKLLELLKEKGNNNDK